MAKEETRGSGGFFSIAFAWHGQGAFIIFNRIFAHEILWGTSSRRPRIVAATCLGDYHHVHLPFIHLHVPMYLFTYFITPSCTTNSPKQASSSPSQGRLLHRYYINTPLPLWRRHLPTCEGVLIQASPPGMEAKDSQHSFCLLLEKTTTHILIVQDPNLPSSFSSSVFLSWSKTAPQTHIVDSCRPPVTPGAIKRMFISAHLPRLRNAPCRTGGELD